MAKDAADVLLPEKDLDVLADGVMDGRRIFANTMKYVLMGTSSNFRNMFGVAGASVFLTLLPMLPSQILLNNLLYDTSRLAIPTDEVDPEQVARPSGWDVSFIRRFMFCFGPISSMPWGELDHAAPGAQGCHCLSAATLQVSGTPAAGQLSLLISVTKMICHVSTCGTARSQREITGLPPSPQRHGRLRGSHHGPFGSKNFISERTGCYGPLPVHARHGGIRRLMRLALPT